MSCRRADLKLARRSVAPELLLRPEEQAAGDGESVDLVVEQLAAELRKEGYEVDLEVGQSSFRCDLAVRRPAAREYAAGILVDTAASYRQLDLIEREVMRPQLLEAFGWRIKHVIAKDWYADQATCLADLKRFIDRNGPEEDLKESDDEKAGPKKCD